MKLQELNADEMKAINGGGGDGDVFIPGFTGDGPASGGPVHGYDPVAPEAGGADSSGTKAYEG